MPQRGSRSLVVAMAAAVALSGCATLHGSTRALAQTPEGLDPAVMALFLEAELILEELTPPAIEQDDRADRAAALLLRAVQMEPESPFLRRYLAEAYASQGEYDKAIEAARAAVGLDPTDAHAQLLLGQQLMLTGEFALAEGHLREAARRGVGGDRSHDPHRQLFVVLRRLDRVDAAIAALDDWTRALPGQSEASVLKAQFLWGTGRAVEAEAAAVAALRLDPGSEVAREILATFHRYDPPGEAEAIEGILASNWSSRPLHRRLVQVFETMGRYDSAVSHLRYVGMLDQRAGGELARRRARLLRLQHRGADAVTLLQERIAALGGEPEVQDLLALASAFEATGDDDAALAALRGVSPESEWYATAAESRVRIHARSGDVDLAVETAVAARQLLGRDRPELQVRLLAEALRAEMGRRDFEAASRILGDIGKLLPDRADRLRVDLLLARGDAAEAIVILRERVAAEPAALEQVALLARALAEEGDRAGGIDVIDAATDAQAALLQQRLQTAPAADRWPLEEETRSNLAWLLLRRSFIEKEEGAVEVSEATLEAILLESPHYADALNALGYLLAEENRDLPRAEDLMGQALQQRPFSAAFQDSMGWVLYRQGRHDEAIERLQQAAQWQPGDPEILEHLGDAWRAAGDPAEARNAYLQTRDALEETLQDAATARVEEKLRQLEAHVGLDD